MVKGYSHAQPPTLRTIPCLLSVDAYSIYSLPRSIAGGRPFPPRGRAMLWLVTGTHLTWTCAFDDNIKMDVMELNYVGRLHLA
jgi:hypothetical protein